MFGKDNYLTIPKLQTYCFYHNYFKNYKLLNMGTPQKKWWIWLELFHFASKHAIPSADVLNHNWAFYRFTIVKSYA